MSCSCFSSSELFILTGGVGNAERGGSARVRGEGRGGRTAAPAACAPPPGSWTRARSSSRRGAHGGAGPAHLPGRPAPHLRAGPRPPPARPGWGRGGTARAPRPPPSPGLGGGCGSASPAGARAAGRAGAGVRGARRPPARSRAPFSAQSPPLGPRAAPPRRTRARTRGACLNAAPGRVPAGLPRSAGRRGLLPGSRSVGSGGGAGRPRRCRGRSGV